MSNEIKKTLRDKVKNLPPVRMKGVVAKQVVRGDTLKNITGRTKTDADEPINDSSSYLAKESIEVNHFKKACKLFKTSGMSAVDDYVDYIKGLQLAAAGQANEEMDSTPATNTESTTDMLTINH